MNGNWGKEAQNKFSRLASHLAIRQSSPQGNSCDCDIWLFEYGPDALHCYGHPGQGALMYYNSAYAFCERGGGGEEGGKGVL